jgi:hypothetical protein
LQLLADAASRVSLANAASYGAGLHKFHIFCDIFSIPKDMHLPAPFHIIHSFALWAASDPNSIHPDLNNLCTFKTIATSMVHKYLSAIWAWHIAQGWLEPLSEQD